MSASKALLTLSVVAAGPCVGTTPSNGDDSNVLYECDDLFDTACRFRADVDIDSGAASYTKRSDYSGYTSTIELDMLEGTVTLSDTQGEHPDVTCGFTLDTVLGITSDYAWHDVAVSNAIVFDSACPIECAWFLPQPGSFTDAEVGAYAQSSDDVTDYSIRYGLGPDAPILFWTEPVEATTTYLGTDPILTFDGELAPSSFSAPMLEPTSIGAPVERTCW